MTEIILNFRRQLRKNQTEVEKKLWRHLRSKQFKRLKFRRQEQIGQYIVDFVRFKIKLIVSITLPDFPDGHGWTNAAIACNFQKSPCGRCK